MMGLNKLLNRFIRLFDRSFSSGWVRQVMFLGSLMLVFFLLCALAMYLCAINSDISEADASFKALVRTLELMLDPGSFSGSGDYKDTFPILLQFITTIIGAVIFTAMLITVLGNIVSNRVENYKKGRVRYNFDNHVLVLGANSMLTSMLREFIQTGVHQNRKIVVLTTQDTENLHDKILSDIPDFDQKLDVTWLNGSRIIDQTLRNVQVDEAYSIYILGEDNELDHDSLNLECWRLVKSICKDIKRAVQCYLVVDRVSTYHVLQYGKKEKDTWLYLNIINSLENWAQRVLVSCEYMEGVRYPSIDRLGITEDSDKSVRFVIYGMTQMSYAMASTVAHIAHFPNFKKGKNRTKICFISPDIQTEMDFYLGHYDNIFRLAYANLTHWDENGQCHKEPVRMPDTKYGDFLDVEWEFIDGSIESTNVRQLLEGWSSNEKEYLSIALCENEANVNLAASLYLPEVIYVKDIPVFVYQASSGEVLKYAHNTNRYSNIYPFGMKDECYDPLFRNRIVKAKKINYLYQLEDNGLQYDGMPDLEVLEEYWNTRVEYLFKLSNLYAANSIPIKLRSVGIDPDTINEDTMFTHRDIHILSETEHNRWNMERLLLGMQPLYESKRLEINKMIADSDPEIVKQGKTINRHLKNNNYHKDIAPYEELLNSSRQYDITIVKNILDVIKGQ